MQNNQGTIRSLRPYYVIWGLAVAAPLLIYIMLRVFPELDPTWDSRVGHFYIVTFTSLIAVVSAGFMFLVIGSQSAEALFLTLAFAAMAGIFYIHGVSTPGILVPGPNIAVAWAARLSLTIGALLIVLAIQEYSPAQVAWLAKHRYLIAFIVVIVLVILGWLMLSEPPIVQHITASEFVSLGMAIGTIVLLIWGAFRSWRRFQRQGQIVYFVLTIAQCWLAMAQFSQYEAPRWQLSWWLYHVCMLGAYLMVMALYILRYERNKEFRLSRYFLLLALVMGLPTIFLLGEVSVRLVEREDLRWVFNAIFGLTILLLTIALFILVYRAQQIMNARQRLIEQEKQWRIDMTNLLAHDLMSPLSAIVLDLDLLQRQIQYTDDSPLAKRVNRIRRSSETMSALVNDMLNVEKMESGTLVLKKAMVDLRTLVEEVIQNTKGVAEYHNISVKPLLPDAPVIVTLDLAIIRRVLQNLLSNALKFAPPGGQVAIGLHQEASFVCCEVSDNGPGIPVDKRTTIFNKFNQARDSDQKQGFGLGLAFCRLAVEAHNGTIHVEDNPGGGSVFVFTLPCDTRSGT